MVLRWLCGADAILGVPSGASKASMPKRIKWNIMVMVDNIVFTDPGESRSGGLFP